MAARLQQNAARLVDKRIYTCGRTPTILTCVRAFSECREKLPRLWPLAIMNKYAQFW